MSDPTFTLTVALVDDTGATYDPDDTGTVLHYLAGLAGVEVFTRALGIGIDTATGETEPILVWAGTGTAHGVATFGDYCADYARRYLNQRGIGWSVDPTGDTYRLTAGQ